MTDEQKNIIRDNIDDFKNKFILAKNEFKNLGYSCDESEELAWASFVCMNAGITPENYKIYYLNKDTQNPRFIGKTGG